MHLKTSQQSCVGCHAAKQAAANCAGCHNRMVKTGRPDEATCRQCHVPLPEGFGALGANLAATPQQKAGIAETMLKSRNLNPGTYAASDIPETVKIKDLTDKYEPAEFPHRKIVQSLTKGMKDSPLAGYFHRDPGTMCQGCHHNSPASKNPPNCSACHGKNFDAKHPDRPGLQAAFHGQCNDCHKDMGLKQLAATNCTECHKEKQK